MTVVTLFGAGGKMGVRLSRNLAKTDFTVRHVEVSEAGQARLKAEVVELTGLPGASHVLMSSQTWIG